MEWVETTGKSVDEAKDAALDELGIDEDEAEFEVVEEAKQGLFGMLRREARVRARVRPTQPRPKVDRRRSRKSSGSKSGSGSRGGGSKGGASKGSGSKGSGSRSNGGKGGKGGGGEAADAPERTAPVEEDRPATDGGTGRPPAKGGAKGSRRGKGAAASNGGAAASTDGPPADVPSTEEPSPSPAPASTAPESDPVAPSAGSERVGVDAERRSGRQRQRSRNKAATSSPPSDTTQGAAMSESTASLEEQAEITEEFLDGLLDAFGLDGEISTVSIDDETTEVRIDGEELGLLIGQKGRTLQAVGDLSRTVLQRRLPGRHEGRLRVDVAGYRERRREALQRFAQDVGEQVRESGTRRVLEPMSPADRKVVHDVLNEVDGVTTTSEGDEPRRRVVVLPAD